MRIKKVLNLSEILFLLAVVGSLLSQTPQMLESGIGRILQLLWFLPAVSLLLTNHKSFLNKSLLPFYITLFIFGGYCFLLDTFSTVSYIGADLINICISTMITCISFAFFRKNNNPRFTTIFSITLLITGTILALIIYKEFLAGFDIMQKTYAYKAKNSIGQILFCSILIPILCFKPKDLFIRFSFWGCLLVVLSIIFLLKSRATLAGVFFVIVYFIFKSKNKTIKRITISIAVLCGFILLTNPDIYELIVDGILFAGRDAEDLNDLSSGRVELVTNILQQIPDNIFFGLGHFYLDCMPIAFLGQYGIIGSSVVFIFLISLSIKILKLDLKDDIYLTTFLLWSVFLINALFEANPPFGPGIKCFLLWVLVGFTLAKKEKEKKNEYHNVQRNGIHSRPI